MKTAEVIPKNGDKHVFSNFRSMSLLEKLQQDWTDPFTNRRNSQWNRQKHYSISIFVNFKKIFDTIDHYILLDKLSKFGIRGVAHQWIESYLKNRKQYVQINNMNSELSDRNCGVPQGSVLDPKLFILYLNDIVNVSKLFKCILFADDTTFLFSGKNIIRFQMQLRNNFYTKSNTT